MIGLLRTSVTRWEEAEPARCDYDQAETATKLAEARLDATELNMLPMIRLCSVAQARFRFQPRCLTLTDCQTYYNSLSLNKELEWSWISASLLLELAL